jgi:hypothetical protein
MQSGFGFSASKRPRPPASRRADCQTRCSTRYRGEQRQRFVAWPSGQGVADPEGGEAQGRGLFGELQEGAVSGRPSMIASRVGSR